MGHVCGCGEVQIDLVCCKVKGEHSGAWLELISEKSLPFFSKAIGTFTNVARTMESEV